MSLKYRDANGVEQGIAGTPYDILSGLDTTIENEVITRSTLSAHNLLDYPYWRISPHTNNGVTFTANSDGSITLSGTSTDTAYYQLNGNDSFNKFAGKDLIMSIKTTGLSDKTQVGLLLQKDSSYNIRCSAENEELNFTYPSTYTNYCAMYVEVQSGINVDGVVVYPMLRLVTDTDDTYQPYAMTNRELTYKCLAESYADGTKTYRDIIYELMQAIPSKYHSILTSNNVLKPYNFTMILTLSNSSNGGNVIYGQWYVSPGCLIFQYIDIRNNMATAEYFDFNTNKSSCTYFRRINGTTTDESTTIATSGNTFKVWGLD